MARTGRPTTNPATIARKGVIADIHVAATTGRTARGTFRKVQNIVTRDADAFASATASAMLGNGLRATVRHALTEAQGGACFTCGAPLNTKGVPATAAEIFRLIPSILGADGEVAGWDGGSAGTLPGNVVAVCTMCSDDRNRAMAAMGEPIAVTVDTLTDADLSTIVYALPKSPSKVNTDAQARAHALASADGTDGMRRIAHRRAARIAKFGW